MTITTSVHERLHRTLVFDRRRDRLADVLLDLLPDPPADVLDVGCGNGEIGALLVDAGHRVRGVETLAREACAIDVVVAPPGTLPFDDGEFDRVVLVDVLHHAADAAAVLAEAIRVAPGGVVVKDHVAEGRRHRLTLGIMDWVGNRQFGVGRDGRYRSRAEWRRLFDEVGVEVGDRRDDLDLYPSIVKPVFETGLHFVADLRPRRS